MKNLLFLIFITITTLSQAQVTWTTFNNGSNPLTITADGVESVYIPAFTAQGGTDGLIAVSIGYTQPTNNGITSIQFSSTFLTKGVSVSQMVGGVYAFSEIWYAPIGSNDGVFSFVDVQFADPVADRFLNLVFWRAGATVQD